MKKMTLFLLAAVLALTACSAGKKKNDSAAAFAETAAVTAGEPAAKALLEEAAAALEISFAPEDSAQAVTGDIRLPVGGLHGCAVSWDSDRPEIISRTGTVTRPYDNGVTVNLTATVTENPGAVNLTVNFSNLPSCLSKISNSDPVLSGVPGTFPAQADDR